MEYRTAIAYALILILVAALAGGLLYLTRYGRAERRLERLAERGRRSRRKQRRLRDGAGGA
jgi:hypothetical protein